MIIYKKKRIRKFFLFWFRNGTIFSLFLAFSSDGLSWGGRGHNTICETAVHLVQIQELKQFLKFRPHVMGHLCNIPDIHWKNIGGDVRKQGDPTHYINTEVLGLGLKDIPTLSYQEIQLKFKNQKNHEKGSDGDVIKDLSSELGSNWWRVDQFYRRVVDRKEAFSKAIPPANKKEGFDDTEYNQLVFATIVDLGIMGHFVGDNSQPFHVTSDYDGYQSGHGGIHSFYEEVTLAQFGSELPELIISKAKSLKGDKEFSKILKLQTPLEKMKALALLSAADISKVLEADSVVKKSEVKHERGMSLKTAAQRLPAEKAFLKFKKLQVLHLARATLLLANIWDQTYTAAGRPNLKDYRSFKFPFTPDFIAPDYIK